jgi:RNA polymerase sigma-70 factor, ECF subfamily
MSASTPLPPDAIETLLAARARFLAFLRSRVDSIETAEDILQTAFLRSLDRGGALRDDESVVAWFYRVLRNAVIDHYRSRAARTRALDEFARELETRAQPEAGLKDEVCDCIRTLVDGLKPEYREAIEVVDLGEASLQALADRTGITPGNAAVRVHRARMALRKRVRDACAACATHGCVDCGCPPPVAEPESGRELRRASP